MWTALVALSAFASAPALAAVNEHATLLLEDEPHHPTSGAAPEFVPGPATWTVSPDGARATAEFEIPGRLKGSIDFVAYKTLASPSRAMVIRLDLLDPVNDPIANVLVPSVDALQYPTGPRLKGVVSRRDDKTFDVRLDEAAAAVDAKAIGIGSTIDVTFRLQSGRLGRVSIDRDAEGAQALARIFPPVAASGNDENDYERSLSNERAEADAAQAMFGDTSSGAACYARVYDAEHLRSHPHQRVVDIAMNVQMASRADPANSSRISTKAIWTFSVSANLRNGVAAGAVKAKVRRIERVLLKDSLHDELLLTAFGGAEGDRPDQFTLADDAKHAVYSPLDESGMGNTWPDSNDPTFRRNPTKTDDDSFRLDRADPSVCADIARRAHSATKMIVRLGFGEEE